MAALPSDRRHADITGGRDSRLILALMLEAGVTDAFDFRTIGAPHAPDAVVGARIAERFGLLPSTSTKNRKLSSGLGVSNSR